MLVARDLSIRCKGDSDHVEPEVLEPAALPRHGEPGRCQTAKPPLFLWPDGHDRGRGTRSVQAAVSFHFEDDERVTVHGDDVDFAQAHSPVAVKDPPAPLNELPRADLFRPTAEGPSRIAGGARIAGSAGYLRPRVPFSPSVG